MTDFSETERSYQAYLAQKKPPKPDNKEWWWALAIVVVVSLFCCAFMPSEHKDFQHLSYLP